MFKLLYNIFSTNLVLSSYPHVFRIIVQMLKLTKLQVKPRWILKTAQRTMRTRAQSNIYRVEILSAVSPWSTWTRRRRRYMTSVVDGSLGMVRCCLWGTMYPYQDTHLHQGIHPHWGMRSLGSHPRSQGTRAAAKKGGSSRIPLLVSSTPMPTTRSRGITKLSSNIKNKSNSNSNKASPNLITLKNWEVYLIQVW